MSPPSSNGEPTEHPVLTPTSRVLLCAFYDWLCAQRPETLADVEFWNGPRLVDQFMTEWEPL